jgi:hypothetical protein
MPSGKIPLGWRRGIPMTEQRESKRTLSGPRAVLLGGLFLGALDGLFANVFWVPRGASVGGVFRSVAAGVLGSKTARAGGVGTALLGVGLHFFIATCMVLAYYVASRRLTLLVRRPVACGVPYGVFLYLFMNLVVLPLSAVGMPKFDNLPWVASSVIMHALFGVICAMAAGRAP